MGMLVDMLEAAKHGDAAKAGALLVEYLRDWDVGYQCTDDDTSLLAHIAIERRMTEAKQEALRLAKLAKKQP